MRFFILTLLFMSYSNSVHACAKYTAPLKPHNTFKASITRENSTKKGCMGLWLSYPKQKLNFFSGELSRAWLSIESNETSWFSSEVKKTRILGTILTPINNIDLIPDELRNPKNIVSYLCLDQKTLKDTYVYFTYDYSMFSKSDDEEEKKVVRKLEEEPLKRLQPVMCGQLLKMDEVVNLAELLAQSDQEVQENTAP